ncbi:hypothetical protein K7X08_032134 [Anisodus acutangulus]|uniref:Uncharacterized protein n=1 Tax=Anisodus acutangulus TaxID=402998 RepID=A0A9Q1MMF8_9SOLA|nr:hypothetical protein K7X08_032134 [Anisodus acutangulus]
MPQKKNIVLFKALAPTADVKRGDEQDNQSVHNANDDQGMKEAEIKFLNLRTVIENMNDIDLYVDLNCSPDNIIQHKVANTKGETNEGNEGESNIISNEVNKVYSSIQNKDKYT